MIIDMRSVAVYQSTNPQGRYQHPLSFAPNQSHTLEKTSKHVLRHLCLESCMFALCFSCITAVF
jgi:hypothetical protein